MADAMVTARMVREKKEAGARALERLGVTASEAINQLYDHLIATGELPFGRHEERPRWQHSREEWERAAAFVDGIPKRDRFSIMTDDDIRRERLASRGLVDFDWHVESDGECA